MLHKKIRTYEDITNHNRLKLTMFFIISAFVILIIGIIIKNCDNSKKYLLYTDTDAHLYYMSDITSTPIFIAGNVREFKSNIKGNYVYYITPDFKLYSICLNNVKASTDKISGYLIDKDIEDFEVLNNNKGVVYNKKRLYEWYTIYYHTTDGNTAEIINSRNNKIMLNKNNDAILCYTTLPKKKLSVIPLDDYDNPIPLDIEHNDRGSLYILGYSN